NLVGLIAILASVVYGCATFLNITLGSYLWPAWRGAFGGDVLVQQFALFVVLMIVVTASNIFSGHLMATMSNLSVWWHVGGTALVVVVLAVVPERHQSVGWVFGERLNASGFGDGTRSGPLFWLYVLPLGFLLTQYTITGFDACAHLSEETRHAAHAAARGLW